VTGRDRLLIIHLDGSQDEMTEKSRRTAPKEDCYEEWRRGRVLCRSRGIG
jgi:hypothetical protein